MNVAARPDIDIRDERPDDEAAVRDVHRFAFRQDLESRIVDALRANKAALVSLVAIEGNRVVGHIMYSPASIGDVVGAGLAPVAVLPEYQRRGIGSRLIEEGNRRLGATGCPFIVVLGHAEYYPRFGFQPASRYNVTCEWNVPDEAFMLLALDVPRVQGISGLARYRHEFSAA